LAAARNRLNSEYPGARPAPRQPTPPPASPTASHPTP